MPLYKQQYTTTDRRTGKRVKKQTRKWYCLYKRKGRWIRVPAYTDKAASQQKLARLELEAARETEGIRDHLTEHARRPLADHLAAFKQHLADRGNTPLYVRTTSQRVEYVVAACKAELTGDLSASRVDSALAGLVRAGRSTSSRNHYLRAVKMFTTWLVTDRRAADDPLAGMARRNIEDDRRRTRRALSVDEFDWLVRTTAKGEEAEGMPGPDRAMLYILAAYTGCRRNELGSLRRASFDLGSEPTMTVAAGTSKRRRTETIPLRADLAQHLRGWLEEKPDKSPLFPVTGIRTAELLAEDLGVARAAWIKATKTRKPGGFLLARDEDGRVVDFHALRGTFITRLSQSGVSPKMAQTLARHSDINLTMQTYTFVELADQRAAIEALPAIPLAAKTLHKGLHKVGSSGVRSRPIKSAQVRKHGKARRA